MTNSIPFVFQDIKCIADFAKHTMAIIKDLDLYGDVGDLDVFADHLNTLINHYVYIEDNNEYYAVIIEYIRNMLILWPIYERDINKIKNITGWFSHRDLDKVINKFFETFMILI